MLPRAITAILRYWNCLRVICGICCRRGYASSVGRLARCTSVVVFSSILMDISELLWRHIRLQVVVLHATMGDAGNRTVLYLPESGLQHPSPPWIHYFRRLSLSARYAGVVAISEIVIPHTTLVGGAFRLKRPQR